MLTYILDSPKTRSLYLQIRTDIEQGIFAPGSRLPSRRQIASDLGVSLSTVENALDLLEEEGYVQAKERSGVFVCSGMQAQNNAAFSPCLLEEDAPAPDPEFPLSLWHKTMRLVMSRDQQVLSQKSPVMGAARLRNVIAAYLWRVRAMKVQPRQIVIAAGTETLYEMLCRMFLPEFSIAIESPGYSQIEAVYASFHVPMEKLPMEKEGICPNALALASSQFLHVTPFSSYPTGITASAARRRAYLSWIEQRQGYLIEDDINSEFFRAGPLLQTLYAMDTGHKVIYLNTFSSSLSSSLRLAYMVLPEHLLPLFDQKAGMFSSTLTMLMQYTLAEFIENGSFEQLVRRRRRHLGREKTADF